MVQIIIDRNRCEGKANCVEACGEGVLELRAPDPGELSWHSRIRLRFHGGKQAFTIRPESCTACLACVEACSEQAITVTS